MSSPLAVSASHPIAYTVLQAAAAVGLSERYIRAQIAHNYLIPRYAGTKPLIGHDELVRWFAKLPTDPRR